MCVRVRMCDAFGVLKVWSWLFMCYRVRVRMCVNACMCECVYVWCIWRIEGLVMVVNVLLGYVCPSVCKCVCAYV